jgi:hypothetical protein
VSSFLSCRVVDTDALRITSVQMHPYESTELTHINEIFDQFSLIPGLCIDYGDSQHHLSIYKDNVDKIISNIMAGELKKLLKDTMSARGHLSVSLLLHSTHFLSFLSSCTYI